MADNFEGERFINGRWRRVDAGKGATASKVATAGKAPRFVRSGAGSPYATALRAIVAAAVCISIIMTAISSAFFGIASAEGSDDELVILLDPGHGGLDVGAINTSAGLYESEINLKIAIACRDYLERYDNVSVYMTHTGVRSSQGSAQLLSRVNVIEEVDADIFISLHINSADDDTAKGSEVYVPYTTYKDEYNKNCTELAEKILENLTSLGLTSRGVKTKTSGSSNYVHEDGTTEAGDYYYVVREPIRRFGIPGILVEHAFIGGDAEFLDSDEELTALGEADARAIAEYYGLELSEEYAEASAALAGDESSDAADEIAAAGEASDDTEQSGTPVENVSSVSAVSELEDMIAALPSNPTASDHDELEAAKQGYIALSDGEKSELDATMYRKLKSACEYYAELTHPVRFTVKRSSQLEIDRITNSVSGELSGGTSDGATVFDVMLELEIYVDESGAEKYQDESALDCYVTDEDGTRLGYYDSISDGCVISVAYEQKVLDSLELCLSD